MPKNYVAGVWKSSLGFITHIQVNNAKDGVLHPVGKWFVQQGIRFIQTRGNELFSAIWNYSSAPWKEGQKIIVVNDTLKYLRTAADNTVRDNLDNLIPMINLFKHIEINLLFPDQRPVCVLRVKNVISLIYPIFL